MRARSQRRLVVMWAIPMAIVALSLGVIMVSNAQSSPGCDIAEEGSIKESEQFAPVESRLSPPLDPLIKDVDQEAVPAPQDAFVASIDGLPNQWVVVAGDGAVYQYFHGDTVDGLSVSGFRAAGGIELDRDPVDGSGDFIGFVLDTLGERATKMPIGDWTGALVWADPLVNGIRPHYLYWSDGKWTFALMADMPPDRLVNLARDLVCDGAIGG